MSYKIHHAQAPHAPCITHHMIIDQRQHIISHMSCIRHHAPYIICHISYISVPCALHHMSYHHRLQGTYHIKQLCHVAMYHISHIMYHMSYISVPGALHHISYTHRSKAAYHMSYVTCQLSLVSRFRAAVSRQLASSCRWRSIIILSAARPSRRDDDTLIRRLDITELQGHCVANS
jgi:hypothetical protein